MKVSLKNLKQRELIFVFWLLAATNKRFSFAFSLSPWVRKKGHQWSDLSPWVEGEGLRSNRWSTMNTCEISNSY